MSAPAVPIVGQSPTPQQVRAEIGRLIAQALEDPSLATQFLQDIHYQFAGPGLVLEQKRSALELTPQRIVIPIALLMAIAGQLAAGEARQDLAQLGIRLANRT